MKINKFPPTMWDQQGVEGKAPAVKRAWKLNVTCGTFGAGIDIPEGAIVPKLSGCGAELIITKKDYYRKGSFDGGGVSFYFMCPCCGTENPLIASVLELNAKIPEKMDWLILRRESIVAELLLANSLPKGCTTRTVELLRKLKLEVPDQYAVQESSLLSKIVAEG